jgi:hypothetical protein
MVRFVIYSTPKRLLRAGACCAALICGGALAQQGEGAADGRKPPPVGDEVIVIGKSPGQLRVEMERAEEAVYDRFNALNRDRQFDIHCWREAPINSHVSRRVCRPNFWRDAEARAGQESLRALQGGAVIDPAMFLAAGDYKTGLMRQQMKRVAAEDEQFQSALVRFVKLKEALEGAARSPSRTKSVETAGGQGSLPYGAALAADVHIGRQLWRRALTHRTFTFGEVQGEIGRLEIKCGERTEELRYEDAAEWTLPEDWKDCDLRVEAPRGTTFTLYQFD